VTQHWDEMRDAVEVCESLGVPFAIPAVAFPLQRAAPIDRGDGYVHCLGTKSRPRQMALKRLFDVSVATVALVLLAPLMRWWRCW